MPETTDLKSINIMTENRYKQMVANGEIKDDEIYATIDNITGTVVNNTLTSESTTDALSANMGRLLNETKVNVAQGAANANKLLSVGSNGNVELIAPVSSTKIINVSLTSASDSIPFQGGLFEEDSTYLFFGVFSFAGDPATSGFVVLNSQSSPYFSARRNWMKNGTTTATTVEGQITIAARTSGQISVVYVTGKIITRKVGAVYAKFFEFDYMTDGEVGKIQTSIINGTPSPDEMSNMMFITNGVGTGLFNSGTHIEVFKMN